MKVDFDEVIGNVLRIGVIISAMFILIGLIELFLEGGGQGYSLSEISSVHSIVNSSSVYIFSIPTDVARGDGLATIYLGLIALIATPVIRVGISVINFALEKDLLYTIITIIVLTNLLIAIFILPYIILK